MLRWLNAVRRPNEGDRVQVTEGPYAGRIGVVQRVEGGMLAVFIDECCQPRLPAASLRRGGRSDVGRAVRTAKASDVEGEIARTTMNARDFGNGF